MNNPGIKPSSWYDPPESKECTFTELELADYFAEDFAEYFEDWLYDNYELDELVKQMRTQQGYESLRYWAACSFWEKMHVDGKCPCLEGDA